MEMAKLFIDGGSQALSLPRRVYNFPTMDEVYIHRCGNKIILESTKRSWENLKKGINMLPDNFDFKCI